MVGAVRIVTGPGRDATVVRPQLAAGARRARVDEARPLEGSRLDVLGTV